MYHDVPWRHITYEWGKRRMTINEFVNSLGQPETKLTTTEQLALKQRMLEKVQCTEAQANNALFDHLFVTQNMKLGEVAYDIRMGVGRSVGDNLRAARSKRTADRNRRLIAASVGREYSQYGCSVGLQVHLEASKK